MHGQTELWPQLPGVLRVLPSPADCHVATPQKHVTNLHCIRHWWFIYLHFQHPQFLCRSLINVMIPHNCEHMPENNLLIRDISSSDFCEHCHIVTVSVMSHPGHNRHHCHRSLSLQLKLSHPCMTPLQFCNIFCRITKLTSHSWHYWHPSLTMKMETHDDDDSTPLIFSQRSYSHTLHTNLLLQHKIKVKNIKCCNNCRQGDIMMPQCSAGAAWWPQDMSPAGHQCGAGRGSEYLL